MAAKKHSLTTFNLAFDRDKGRDNVRLELIYKTPNDSTTWRVLAALHELKHYGFEPFVMGESQFPDLDDMEEALRRKECKYKIERQDIIDGNIVIPSFRGFSGEYQFCIHRNEGDYYHLHGMSCAYYMHQGDGFPDWDVPLKKRTNAKSDEDHTGPFEPLKDNDAFIFIAKYKFQNNLRSALDHHKSREMRFVSPDRPKL